MIPNLRAMAALHSPAKRCTLLDYISTYSNDGIIYSASNMILSAHSGTGFNNELWWFLTLPAMHAIEADGIV